MNEKKIFVFALCMAGLSVFPAKHNHNVYLEPQNQAKHINESFELVCTVSGCAQEVGFTWRTPEDSSTGGKSTKNQTVSRLVFNKLSIANEQVIVCGVVCGSHKRENKTKIRLYSFPAGPVISRVDESRLQCDVRDVYPPDMFKIEWLRGNLKISDASYSQGIYQDIYSVYTTTDEDRGKNITCKVTLSMEGVPEHRAVQSATVQYGPAFIKTSGHITVRLGESLKLSCDTDRESSIMWTKIGKSEAIALGEDHQLIYEHANWSHAGEYECKASSALGSLRSKVNVTVKGPPNAPNITLSQTTDPTEGDNITIFCYPDSVSSVHLTIYGASLNQSKKLSFDQTYTFMNIPSIQLKDSGLYHCEAHNEFGSTRSSINIVVQERQSNVQKIVIPTVSSVSLLGAIAVVLRFLKKFQKNSQDIAIDAVNI